MPNKRVQRRSRRRPTRRPRGPPSQKFEVQLQPGGKKFPVFPHKVNGVDQGNYFSVQIGQLLPQLTIAGSENPIQQDFARADARFLAMTIHVAPVGDASPSSLIIKAKGFPNTPTDGVVLYSRSGFFNRVRDTKIHIRFPAAIKNYWVENPTKAKQTIVFQQLIATQGDPPAFDMFKLNITTFWVEQPTEVLVL